MTCPRCGNEEHEAGRETDACVNYLIMGGIHGGMHVNQDGELIIPNYSTNIADAWQIMDKFEHDELDTEVGHAVGIEGYVCYIGRYTSGVKHSRWALTAPLAICLAALEAI